MFLSQRVHVLSLLQNQFGLVFFRLFDGALETSNFRFEEARFAITLLRCFLHENTQRGKIGRVKFAEELGTMPKNRLRWITLVRGPIWEIRSLTLMISWSNLVESLSPYSCTRTWSPGSTSEYVAPLYRFCSYSSVHCLGHASLVLHVHHSADLSDFRLSGRP